MKILVINAGSSSLKGKLYDMQTQQALAEANCQRVGLNESIIKYVGLSGKKEIFHRSLPTHKEALEEILQLFTTGKTQAIGSIKEIAAIGHRLAMGGAKYVKSVLIDKEVVSTLYELGDVAPLHNPVQARTIEICWQVFGSDLPMVAVFDTAFHQTMPQSNYMFSLPYEYYKKYNLRRYCFHGMSHQYVSEAYAQHTGKDISQLNLITCHMGGGSSITAIKGGKSINNSFGFGIGEGPMGGTRAGTVDYTALSYIMKKENLSFDEVEDVLARESGMLGVSGISSDEYELEKLALEGNERAKLTLDIFAVQIKRYIGSYFFEMGSLDALIFTGGIGENSDYMRRLICENLEEVGISLDQEANVAFNRQVGRISSPDAKVDIWVIPTNEEWVIANDTFKTVKSI
ncbi:acetate kinase [Oscillospiraceae bacterium MB08-C2-2]|nr:acetate kinase [Oscillospiraceae bacterium MB08-C2-2]